MLPASVKKQKDNMKRTLIFALALGLLALGGSAKANLIVNGSFESGAFVDNTGQDTMNLAPGSTAITGWTVTTANLAWIGPSNPFGLTASDGSYFLDLTGYHDNQPYAGVAATSISTVIGQKYEVSFDLGTDPTYNTQLPSIQVSVTGTSPVTFTATTISTINNWQAFNFDFTATGTSTVIGFVGEGPDLQKYIGLDNVSVVPEPTTMVAGTMLLLPFAFSTVRILRRRQTA
jgi:hypothetical protein